MVVLIGTLMVMLMVMLMVWFGVVRLHVYMYTCVYIYAEKDMST